MSEQDILKEVATSLYLLITFSKPAAGMDWDELDAQVFDDMRRKAETSLRQAESLIGPLNAKTIREFLHTRDGKFTLDCGGDVVRRDMIRFMEDVFDERNRKPVYLGRRTIIAEVSEVKTEGRDCNLSLRVLRTEGALPILAGTEIKRQLSAATKFGIRRIPWADEAARPSRITSPDMVQPAPSRSANDNMPPAGREAHIRYDLLKS